MERYDPKPIEAKWQRVWEDERTFNVPTEPGPDVQHHYQLEMLPYPSGVLHMGHVLNYTLGDVITWFRRRNGWVVLRPMGYDSFGLPAENAAIAEGGHPREIVERNIETIRSQMKKLGWAIDWERELSTHDPAFYRWTQWLFLRFFEAGLAYRKEAPVNWCPNDQTVLADSQVIDGHCERCGALVEAKSLEQWFFKITAYADELLEYDLPPGGSWPERTKTIQRNFIGRSEGAEILFRVEELDQDIPVFTTRPDTLFGATFFVLAPEHPLVAKLVAGTPHEEETLAYVRKTAAAGADERAQADREKTGVETGRFATNPVNGERIPIWVADYVLMEYGTGAIMAVPGHDDRDREFAEKFGLPIRLVIDEDERLVNSDRFDGQPAADAKRAIVEWLGEQGRGASAVSFRLRDWSWSRQRYWGCPIPIVYCDDCGVVPVPDDQLPVLLPDIDDYKPKGTAPLATATDWVRTPCPRCGREGRREVDTMDTFVDSAWYFLRYVDPHDETAPFQREHVDHWLPVTEYIGGIDHATGHLLYSRFFVKVLNELGLVGFREPFGRVFHQGWVQMGGSKMSKSKGNVAGPDALVAEHGADAVRLYILFMGPADQDMEWTDSGLEGMSRFVRRLWRTVNEVADRPVESGGKADDQSPLRKKAHETIARVTDDIDRRFQFNTPIAAVMELVNEINRDGHDPASRFAAETAVSLIQPYAPHLAAELWERLGHERVWQEPWPEADPALLERDTFELVVQVNGKVRDRFDVSASLSEDELVARATASPKVQAQLNGKQIRKTIVVPRKLVNIVAS
ncbi:MAG: leucyl-tRNA synthetase [Gaiellaceae bacterium]|jgi:leucyl-tRNA synthetase|nr:leucyl-tRNA synthetase [Gaiellaceae bacterium]